MSKAFFLTRQTANLMEDFVRELDTSASLFLLYGDEGVGKTRTLEELVRTRLRNFEVHWIDLKAGGAGDGALVDSSSMIESVFDKAKPGDIIIADHFEMALKKTRHQLFLSWSTDGIDKKLNLIIAGNTDYFNELRQLAQQYQVRVQSFQQMPFNSDEAIAFLAFYLFPDRPIGDLSIPPLLRNQLVMAQGNVGKIIDIAERAGDQITTAPMDDTESIREGSRIIVGVLITVALVIVVGWYLLSSQRYEDDLQVAQSAASAAGLVQSEDAMQPAAGTTAQVAAAPALDAVPAVDAPTAETVATAEAVAETEAAAEPEAESVAEAEFEQTAMLGDAAAVEPASSQGRLQRDLQNSLDWVNRNDARVGTLQIMLLSLERFDESAYYEYLDELAGENVDTSAIRVLRTWTGGREVYSVVYGEYDSWAAAGDAKDDIPPVLQKISPIPRSVGGLREEMRRLAAEN